MNAYEIRIIHGSGGALVYATQMVSDFSAIRRAQMIAEERKAEFEVWRGMECIFRRTEATKVADARGH